MSKDLPPDADHTQGWAEMHLRCNQKHTTRWAGELEAAITPVTCLTKAPAKGTVSKQFPECVFFFFLSHHGLLLWEELIGGFFCALGTSKYLDVC